MDRSILAAVSGIDANQTYLDVIANNISNANTTGFKTDSAFFDDLLAQQIEGATAPNGIGLGGVNGVAIGSGTRVAAITTNFAEGTLQQTNDPTDVAINGNGFLVVNVPGQQVYTRDGHLLFDASGNLVTDTGGIVQGWQASTAGVINTNLPTTAINVPTGINIPPRPTNNMSVAGNLPSTLPQGLVAAPSLGNPVPPGAVSYSESSTINIFDQQGNAIANTLVWEHTGANQWDLFSSVQAGAGGFTIMGHWTLTFTNAGAINTVVDVVGTHAGAAATGFTLNTINQFADNPPFNSLLGPTAGQPAVNIAIPGTNAANQLTQFNAPDNAQALSQDGFTSGILQGLSIGTTGIITGSFSNGQSLNLGQIALVQFANSSGLTKIGNNYFAATPNSGVPLLNTPGAGGSGTIVGANLESSNVDMGKQLTDLVIAQTSYEANTRVVTTNNTVLNALVNMG